MNKSRKLEIENSFKNWSSFYPVVSSLTLEEVEFAIELEESSQNRSSFVERLIKRRRRLLVEKVREENCNH